MNPQSSDKLDSEPGTPIDFRALPKSEFNEIFGGSSKVHVGWARDFGFPWPGRKFSHVNCVDVLKWLRQSFADRSKKTGTEHEFFGAAEWQGKCWEERFYELRDKRQQRHEQLCWREDVHKILSIIASEIRRLGERLQHKYGPDAQDFVNDALDNIKLQSLAFLEHDNNNVDVPLPSAGME